MEARTIGARRRWTRRSARVVLAAICLIALLGGAYTLYARMTAHPEMAAARYVPPDVAAFAGIDLADAGSNQHRVGMGDLASMLGQRDGFSEQTCLDWQKDVVPNVGRVVAFAAFAPAPSTAVSAPAASAYLLQARSETTAHTMLQRALACQQVHGYAIAQSAYSGFTLYTATANGGRVVAGVAAGAGWLIAANDLQAATAILDRLDGRGATLADLPAFQAATDNIMEARFATLYVNPRMLASVLAPSGAQASWETPLLSGYTWGGGYVMWTAAGMRARLLFHPARPLVDGDLAGDTTSLAWLAPSDTLSYVGIGNLAQWLVTSARFAPPTSTTSNGLSALFANGKPSPLLRQPAALLLLRAGTAPATSSALLLHAPDAAATDALVQQMAHQEHWTLTAVTIGGQPATTISGVGPQLTDILPDGAHAAPAAGSRLGAAHLIAVIAQLGNTLAVTNSATDMETLVATATGQAPSLASLATFQQLIAAAPTDVAATMYLDVPGMMRLADDAPGHVADALDHHARAMLISQNWSDEQLKLILDYSLTS
jgi:hypothetical protein